MSKQISVRESSGALAVPSGESGKKKSIKKALEEDEFTEVS